jgi:GMP synthase (glutamine-hydrolysing)
MKPFLLLSSRAEDVAADGEHAAFLRFGGLRDGELERIRMEQASFLPVDLDRYAGVVVGGSPFDASTPQDEKSAVQRRVEAEVSTLLDEIVEKDLPFFGACYGVGTLGVHQGAVIDRTYAEPIGAVTITLTGAGRTDPLLTGLPDSFEAYVGHKEACRMLPPDAVLLASSPTCPVQMFRVRENLYATQFHPELDLAGITTRIGVYRDYGYYRPGEYDDVVARVRRADVWAPPRIFAAFVQRYRHD